MCIRDRSQLMHFSEESVPNFYIIKGTCPNLIRTIPLMIRDERNPEDLDTKSDDHILDALRYSLTNINAPVKPKKVLSRLEQEIEDLKNYTPDSWSYKFGG